MTVGLQKALDNNNLVFDNLIEVADGILKEYVEDINALIDKAVDNVETLTNDDIRKLMLSISLKSYSFGDIKDKASLKQECAEILRKEKYATEYQKAEGKLGEKENIALLNSNDETLAEAIYDMVSNNMKTKLDEMHRIVDTLKYILVSRNSEAKMTALMSGVGMEEVNE